jgi:hypothetical protein
VAIFTSSLEQSEMNFIRSIEALDCDHLSSANLALMAIRSSLLLQSNHSQRRPEDTQKILLMLPSELQGVLLMPPALRHCYVLRVLLAISRDVSASTLGCCQNQVDDFTCAAMLHLANHRHERPQREGASGSVPEEDTSCFAERAMKPLLTSVTDRITSGAGLEHLCGSTSS